MFEARAAEYAERRSLSARRLGRVNPFHGVILPFDPIHIMGETFAPGRAVAYHGGKPRRKRPPRSLHMKTGRPGQTRVIARAGSAKVGDVAIGANPPAGFGTD